VKNRQSYVLADGVFLKVARCKDRVIGDYIFFLHCLAVFKLPGIIFISFRRLVQV
jgi:hypothetical protein